MGKHTGTRKRLGLATSCLLGVALLCDPAFAQKADPARVKGALSALAKDERAWKTLTVTYDDMHGMHGGLTLTIHGDGRVEQTAVREKVGPPKDNIERAELQRLVALLLEVAAWEQRVPERRPVPDESRARLHIVLDGNSAAIWEWYNDLQKNQRIFRVRELMKKIAWRQP
jgi:hypothetical protein